MTDATVAMVLIAALATAAGTGRVAFGSPAESADPTATDIVRLADQQRGLRTPHAFLARISPQREPGDGGARAQGILVEVRSTGFEQQLVLVLEPNRGDVMLATPDVVWLRPRRLHRLTRIPPDLRMFNGASVADVTAVDVSGSYAATFDAEGDDGAAAPAGPYRVSLVATKARLRYPRATYWIGREDIRPLRIDFMTASGRVLKTVRYGGFAAVLGRTIPTELMIGDEVRHDATAVTMSSFRPLATVDPRMFMPDYLLSIEDDAP